MRCGSCDATLTEGARFCAACGAAAHAQPAVEERRVVTALFCDLVGSTSLSGRLDSEALRAVLLRYFEAVRGRIEAHGGTVEKFIGDAVMAVFGIPMTHEDDARRALTAALDVLGAVEELNVGLEAAFGVRLAVRIGIETGEVVTTPGRLTGQALASGEVLNVAARLEQNAETGQILIGPDTLRAAGAGAVTEPAGLFALKGKTEPVAVHRLLGMRARDPEFQRRYETPFVGREGELGCLDAVLDRVRARSAAAVVCVHGDAGIGKTRLMQEWLARQAPGVLIGAGCARPYGERGTLAALGEAIGRLIEGAGRPEDCFDALATLDSGLLKDGTPNPSVEDTCQAAARVLAALARTGPVVLLIDDCHWGMPALFDLLDQLARAVAGEAVLFVRLGRPEFLEERGARPGAAPDTVVLAVDRLTAAQSALLAADLAEVSPHDVAAGARVLERAEGNPLHLEQLIAALGETGGPDEVPPTVQALLAARISALTQEQRTMLQVAAVVGREFTLSDLIALGAPDPAPAGADRGAGACGPRQTVRDLVGRRLVESVRGAAGDEAVFRFSSGLIQEVTYRGTAKRVRAQCHERMARRCADARASAAVVAGHLESAYHCRADLGPLDAPAETLRRRAARRLAEAGGTALARSDPAWAGDLLERALALARPADPGWSALAGTAAEARLALGRIAAGRQLLAEVLAAEDGLTATHARLSLAATDPQPRPGALAETAREALAVFTRAGDSLGIARASIRIAQEQQFQGRHAAAEQLLSRALAHATRAQAEPERAMALGAIGMSLCWGPVPADAAVDRCRALLAEHRERRSAQVTLACPLAILLSLRGDHAEARAALDGAEEIAQSLGYAEAAVFLPLFSSLVATHAGESARAEALLRAALAVAEQIGDAGLTASIRRDLARVLMERSAATTSSQIPVITAASHTSGEVAATVRPPETPPSPVRLDPVGEALDLLAGAGDLPPSAAADAHGTGARLAVARGDAAVAADLAGRALAAARLTDSPVVLATAELDRAHVLRALGRFDAADAAAAHSATLFARKQHVVGEQWALALRAGGVGR